MTAGTGWLVGLHRADRKQNRNGQLRVRICFALRATGPISFRFWCAVTKSIRFTDRGLPIAILPLVYSPGYTLSKHSGHYIRESARSPPVRSIVSIIVRSMQASKFTKSESASSSSESQSGSEAMDTSSSIPSSVASNASFSTRCQARILWYLDRTYSTKNVPPYITYQ
jgi:hypothetical protein